MTIYRNDIARGITLVNTSEIRKAVIDSWRNVFGADLQVDPSTPQGLIIEQLVQALDSVARTNAEVSSQINPDIASAVFLDALCSLSGIQRKGKTKTLVQNVKLTGEKNTIIPAGTMATSENGFNFLSVDDVVIDESGVAYVDFIAEKPGAIEVQVGELSTITTSILGLFSVYNNHSGITGSDEETDAQLRRRRRKTLAVQSVATPEAIVSHVNAVAGVQSMQFLENISNQVAIIEGIEMLPHSIWCCVQGGEAKDIAEAIFRSKTLGAGMNGAIEIEIKDERAPNPYLIKFDRPIEREFFIRVTCKKSTHDLEAIIPDLVMNYVNQEVEGDLAFIVGVDLSGWEIAGAITQQRPDFFITKVELRETGTSDWTTDTIDIKINEIAKTQRSAISVVIV